MRIKEVMSAPAAICISLTTVTATAAEWSWDPMTDVENALPAGAPSEAKILQAREQIREVADDGLAALYEAAPGARSVIEHAAGYAVFSTFGIKLFFAGGTNGKGVVVNNRTQRRTYMKMVGLQAGLGLGIKKDRLIFVFETQSALNAFINQGWEFGASASLAAAADNQGGSLAGAASVSPGVYLYQITSTGLAAQISASGTKYFKDGDLN
jgi:lipid-binding SYLF domain-containing protein